MLGCDVTCLEPLLCYLHVHLQKDWGQLSTHLAFNFAWFSPYILLLVGLTVWAPAKVGAGLMVVHSLHSHLLLGKHACMHDK